MARKRVYLIFFSTAGLWIELEQASWDPKYQHANNTEQKCHRRNIENKLPQGVTMLY